MPQIFSIPFGAHFSTALARYLLRETDPLKRAQKTVFLPTRQACLDLAQALQESHPEGSLLLPSLIPLGEIDPDEVALSTLTGTQLIQNLPPLITSERRQLLLATLLMSYHKTHNPLSLDRAIDLSRDLIRLIDDMRSNDIPLEELADLNPHIENAEHWHQIVSFLKIISHHWDAILTEENVIESIPYLTRLRQHQIQQWSDAPPPHEVIIAGSQGTIHSTRALMEALLKLPLGTLILQGFETVESLDTFPELSPTHPQYQHYDLLKKLAIEPQNVQSMEESPPSSDAHPISIYEASNLGKEAQIIALKIRHVLEKNRDTKILCLSQDRSLLNRIAIELQRWNIDVVPHQGRSLLSTAWGSFITTAALCFQHDHFLTAFLSLLKHPFSTMPKDSIALFEQALRRYGLPTSLEHIQRDIAPYLISDNLSLHDSVINILKRVKHIFYDPSLPIALKHRRLMAYILDTDDLETYMAHHDAPEASESAVFLESLSTALSAITISEFPYGDLVRKLMENVYHSQNHSSFKNIRLMTPAEGRLLTADLVILGGMNEGCWPLKLTPDPLLSRTLKLTLGLASPERLIGQSAHDFRGAVTRAASLITRSIYTQGTPTAPSRFLVHLEKTHSCVDGEATARELEHWYRHLMFSRSAERLSPPVPCPDVSHRPTTYSITDIETLMKDPYSFYAKRILGLPKLNSLGTEPSARHFGIFIHQFLDQWVHQTSNELDVHLFEHFFHASDYKSFWWYRALDLFQKIREHQGSIFPEKIMTEVAGSLTLRIDQKAVDVHGRADRIDVYPDGIVILDYKTGTPPRLSDIRNGVHPQLGIEAAFHIFGSFKNIPNTSPIKSIECWSLGRDRKFEIVSLDVDPLELAIHMREGMNNILHFFLKGAPYLSHPWGDFSEHDYSHLSRVSEWKHL